MNTQIIFTAKIIKGASRGKELGFPTLNMQIPKRFVLKEGVHACWVWYNMERFMGALHYGPIPVFDQALPSLEVHLIDIKSNLRPKDLRVEVVKFIRNIEIFDSPEFLIAQIQKDVDQIRASLYFANDIL